MNDTPRKPRILVLTDTLTAGGSGRFVALLLQQLDRARFEVELAKVFDTDSLYDIPDDVIVHSLVDEARIEPPVDWGIPQDVLDEMGDGVDWLHSVVDRIAHLVQRTRPDIVYCAPEWVSVIAATASPRFPGHTQLVCRVGALPSAAFPDEGRTRLHALLLRRNFGRAASVVAISDEIARQLVTDFGVDPGMITVFTNPIDLREVQRLAAEPVDEIAFDDGVPSVVFVGRLERVKNLEGLLEAIASLNEKKPVRCVLVGEGSQRGYLQALAKHLGIEGHVQFVGAQYNPFRFVSKASVFVLPSFHEGLGNVILEAMACGCPIVATDITGGITRYLLRDGECGLLVPVGVTPALADALNLLLDDGALCHRLAQNALERVAEFDVTTVMPQHEELLADLGARAAQLRVKPEAEAFPPGPDRGTEPQFSSPSFEPKSGSRLPWAAYVSLRHRLGKLVSAARGARRAQPLRDALLGRDPDRTRVMVVVSHLSDVSVGRGAEVLLCGLDRTRFEVSLVRIFGTGEAADLPGDVGQYDVLTDSAGSEPVSVPETVRTSYPAESAWLAAVAAGIARRAVELGPDVIVAQGHVATCAVALAKQSLPPGTCFLAAIHTPPRQLADGGQQTGFYNALLTTLLGEAGAVLAPSEAMRRSVLDAYRIDEERLLLVPDPVSFGGTAAAASWPPGVETAGTVSPYVFLCVAEEGFRSGAAQLLEALAIVRRHEDARCSMIGEFDKGDRLEEHIERLHLGGAVRLLPAAPVEGQALDPVFAYVCPAAERIIGVPRALVQALERGFPVISTDASVAVSDLLEQGPCGLLVRRGDPQALAEAMLQLIWDTGVRREMVSHASAHVASLSVESHVRRYEDAIDTCHQASRTTPGE